METLFEELKRYVAWSHDDERALHVLAPHAAPELERIASDFYDRILQHEEAKKALEGGESQVGRLKITLKAWMHSLFEGPWDEVYYERRARIGRVHVRIALPQHYMFGAMDVLHCELKELIERAFGSDGETRRKTSIALTKVLDLELAIMLHTYREDLIAQQSRSERLATFGQLVGSIGHELRNPLGVMESSLYILKGRIGDDERAKKHVDRIGDQLQVANHIITDLLDMIRDRPLQRESVNLAALVESVLSVARRPETVSIEVRGFDQLATFRCDGSKLRQVISNLVDNAIHAVGGAGRVLAEATSSSNGIAIAVQDSGPGVDPAMRARLFEPLTTNKVKGIGLGLALVRRIVEQHGGSIAYEPPSEGGARFVVRLPIADTHA